MGHERIGFLPRSIKWDKIRDELAKFADTGSNSEDIAKRIIQNVSSQFQSLVSDTGSKNAIRFLLFISQSYKESPKVNDNIKIPDSPTPIQLLKVFNTFAEKSFSSREYEIIIKNSLSASIARFFNSHNTEQENLFSNSDGSDLIWQKLSNAKGFCEIARYYFASLTENYLKYFLDREASLFIRDFNARERLSNSIKIHSFETAGIVQSFSAGWYNKHSVSSVPNDKAIWKYLSYASQKIKSELIREESSL